MNNQEARVRWQSDAPVLADGGVHFPEVQAYLPTAYRKNWLGAMDAMPALSTNPSSGIPALLTTLIDPKVIRIVFTPLQFAKILGEQKIGDWTIDTDIFPVIEETGEVSSYGDFNNNGRAGINLNFPNFQNYLFQTFVRYGEREIDRVAKTKVNYVTELQTAASDLLNRFGNFSYAFGIAGLQNYGIINNPFLSAFLTPALKANGGTTWFSGTSPNATANEVYNDVVALWDQIIAQTNGTVDLDDEAVLAISPQSALALRFANSFGVYVKDLLKEGFPNMKIMTAPQYGVKNTANPQGSSAAGNTIQLIVRKIQGQEVVYAAFSEKLRAHKLIPESSAWSQKYTSGSWGAILRMPLGVASMVGV